MTSQSASQSTFQSTTSQSEIPSYGSASPLPAREYSAAELKRINAETRALASVTARELIARAAELARKMGERAAPDDRTAFLDRLREDAAATLAAWSSERGAEREQHRLACDALRLHRACARARCRRAQACLGDPLACHARADVPEPVQDFVAAQLLAGRVPLLALLAGDNAADREAYECWIAGLEAGAARAQR
jgi:hypothetical protein